MTEELKKYINKIHTIPDKLLDEFIKQWEFKKSDKKEIVTMSQTIERYLYFTTKGIQKAYYVKDDKEFIVAFTYPFAFTCIPESFLTQKPSFYTFECLTESEFLRISYNDFSTFIERNHEFEVLLRKTLISALGGVVNRYHKILSQTMTERFSDFMKNSPQLINQIPHKEIANYLKMDPTNFSKLLNSIKT